MSPFPYTRDVQIRLRAAQYARAMTAPMQRPRPAPPGPTDIEIVLSTAGPAPRVVVVIPTFRRPDHLRLTLGSVLRQADAPAFAVVVMDNDAAGREGVQVASELLRAAPVPGRVIVAHRRGNCAAYNAGFHVALGEWPDAQAIAIIDDDEIAPDSWLSALWRTARETRADCVGAPQRPVFAAETPGDARAVALRHRALRAPYATSGPVPILYSSGNVLLSASLLRTHGHPWFDERFNFLGGGDADFYARARAQGARFAWAEDAGVDETMPARRAEASWLDARSLRNGSISALLQVRQAKGMPDRLKRLAKSGALFAASPYRACALFLKHRSLTVALDPMLVALGRVLMEFGFANEQYRAAEAN